jgi:Xanthosine triphosphate pyrophosphatase
MREMLCGLDIDIIGLNDVKVNIAVDESGNSPLENARIKALEYYKAAGIPTFSCDSGLYIEGLEDNRQPGVHVRRVDNKYMGDEEYIKYYTSLVLEMGKDLRAKFKNALCLVLDEEHIFEYDGDDIADNFVITYKDCGKRKPGFPMDSIALDIETGRYLIDSEKNNRNEVQITKGFRDFFKKVVLDNSLYDIHE